MLSKNVHTTLKYQQNRMGLAYSSDWLCSLFEVLDAGGGVSSSQKMGAILAPQ